ncbi:MAG: hypothetical protein P8P30_09990 [Rickettsiales bacterium]|nr:hypothetical protein [Rickettsiales bacterium]
MEKSANKVREPSDDYHKSDKRDNVRTFSGEAKKGVSALASGVMGVLNGVFWGALIAIPAVAFLPFASVGAGVIMCVGLTAAFKGIQGASKGYHDAQNNYNKPGRRGHTRDGVQVSDEAVLEAAEKAEKEMPKKTAAERQTLELDSHEREIVQEKEKEEESYQHRDMIDRSRAQAERTR